MFVETWIQESLAIVLAATGVAILMMPTLIYVCVGWRAKRKDIVDSMNDEACKHYFDRFAVSEKPPNPTRAEFGKLYDNWYGRRFFFWPALLLLIAGTIAAVLVTYSGLQRLGYTLNPWPQLPTIAMAATAGAYLWIVDDHILRARQLDFSPADVQWATLRLVISIPMGYAFAYALSEPSKPAAAFVAFALGAFPLATLISMLRRLVNKLPALGVTEEEAASDIVKLQGINKNVVERLNNVDVTTVLQIAYADPVRLVMRSNLSFGFMTDCMSQALAWLYFEDNLAKLRPYGLRGAIEVGNLFDELTDSDTAISDRAKVTLADIAKLLNQSEAAVRNTFSEIQADPYTQFLRSIWE